MSVTRYLRTLQRRLAWLDRRLADASYPEATKAFDRAERAALTWAIHVCEEAKELPRD